MKVYQVYQDYQVYQGYQSEKTLVWPHDEPHMRLPRNIAQQCAKLSPALPFIDGQLLDANSHWVQFG